MLTPIFTQPRTDEIHSSKMVNRLLQSLFAARKLNYIIIYIFHYKISKRQRKLQLYTIKNVLQVKDKAKGNWQQQMPKLPTKIWYWVLTPTETRKMIEWMKCIYIAHISHIISWRFTIILFIEWDWTSACEGTSGYRYQFIIEFFFYLISLTHPTHAWNEGRKLN